MKKYSKLLTVFLLMAIAFSCRDEAQQSFPLDTVNKINGAYVRQVSVASGFFNFFDLTNAKYTVTLEVSDAGNGTLFSSIDVFASFKDVVNGAANKTEKKITTIPSSAFSNSATTGLPNTTYSIKLSEIQAALGVPNSAILPTNTFTFRYVVNMKDGRTFSDTNSSGNLLAGPFYSSPFSNAIGIGCPSTIESGNYVASQQDEQIWFGGPGPLATSKVVTIEKISDVTFLISDISAGGYEACCGSLGYNKNQPALIQDICNNITISSSDAQITAKQGDTIGTWDPATKTITVYYIDSFNSSPTLKSKFVKQ